MEHHFDIEIAAEYGVHAAILLNHIHYWIKENQANERNFYDGEYWTYNSKKAFAELFPYMTERQIDYAIKKLIDGGLIKTGNYNKKKFDQTLWYALTEKGKSILHFCDIHSTKLSNAIDKIVEPIPDIKPIFKNQIQKTTDKSNTRASFCVQDKTISERSDLLESFEVFWSAYPRKVNKSKALEAWYQLAPDKDQVKAILEGIERWERSAQWVNDDGEFIPYPATFLRGERWNDECQPSIVKKAPFEKNYDYGENFLDYVKEGSASP